MTNLCCSLCSQKLSPPDAFCFFAKAKDNMIHLIIKPEFLELPTPLAKNTIQAIASSPFIKTKCNIIVKENESPNPKKNFMTPYKLYCKFCGVDRERNIGCLCGMGPNKEYIYCLSFAKEKKPGVFLSPRTAGASSWKDLQPFFEKTMQTRTEANFEKIDAIKKKSNILLDSKILLSRDIQNLEALNLTEMIPRLYQIESFAQSILNNTIVCLPTGTGKTLVSFMFLRYFVCQNPSKLAIFLAPKIALIQQQYESFSEEIIDLNISKVFCFTSENTFDERQDFLTEFKKYIKDNVFSRNYVLFMTPQILLNMLEAEEFSIHNCCAIVFDEAHNATKNNPYNKIMEHYMPMPDQLKPAILGLTASLAGEETLEKTTELLDKISKNLNCNPFIPKIFIENLEETKNSIEIINKPFEMNKTEKSIQQTLEEFIKDMSDELGMKRFFFSFNQNIYFCK